MIARGAREAESTAQIDWNWQRLESLVWKDHEGHAVLYVDRFYKLAGLIPGTFIYFGYRWEEHPDWGTERFLAVAMAHGWVLVMPARHEPGALAPA